MRAYSALNPIDQIPLPPDTVQTLLLAGGTGQALDWAGSTIGSTAVLAHIVRFSGVSTAAPALALQFHVNLVSTHASLPASGTSITTGTTAGSTGNTIHVVGERTLQIPPWSTGWSAIARSSGYVIAEIWKK